MARREDLIGCYKDEHEAAGCLTWWELEGRPVGVHDLEEAWALCGLDPSVFSATEPAVERVLARAGRAALQGQRQIQRKLPRRGTWEIIAEAVDASVDVGQLQHRPLVQGTIERDAQGRKQVLVRAADAELPAAQEARERVLAAVPMFAGKLTSRDLSEWLLGLLRGPLVHGTALRQRGGFYFVPRDRVDVWERVVDVVAEVQAGTVWTMPALATQDAVRAVLGSVRKEAEAAFSEMETYLLGETCTRGLNGVERRLGHAKAKVAHYASLLAVELPDLSEHAERLGAALTVARLAGRA